MKIQLIDGLQAWVSSVRQALESGEFGFEEMSGQKEWSQETEESEQVRLQIDLEPSATLPLQQLEWSRILIGQVVLSITTSARQMSEPRSVGAERSDSKSVVPLHQVLSLLSCLLHSPTTRCAPVLQVHDMKIDVAARRVYRKDQEITLTRLEFDLLEFLATQRGRVVSATQIRDHLYKDRREVHSNTISVYIGSLRRKIDRGFDPPLILTRWCQGYLLRDTWPVGETSEEIAKASVSRKKKCSSGR